MENQDGNTNSCMSIDSEPKSITAPVSPVVFMKSSGGDQSRWKYSHRLFKKLKQRYRGTSHNNSSASSSTDLNWRSKDSITWRSVDGSEFRVSGVGLVKLSGAERKILQNIALQRIHQLLPNVQIGKQKDPSWILRQKRQMFFKARGMALNISDSRRSNAFNLHLMSDDAADERKLFGVPLNVAIEFDRKAVLEERCRSLDEAQSFSMPSKRKISTMKSMPVKSDSELNCNENEKSAIHTNLLTGFNENVSSCEKLEDFDIPRFPIQNVPRIVTECIKFLRIRGLHTIGIFRVAGSAKRCRELRKILEESNDPILPLLEKASPHDVASLLKEYFRDLPEPLLHSGYYHAFIATEKTQGAERIECIKLLIASLSVSNADTLYALLQFLNEVAECSADHFDSSNALVSKELRGQLLSSLKDVDGKKFEKILCQLSTAYRSTSSRSEDNAQETMKTSSISRPSSSMYSNQSACDALFDSIDQENRRRKIKAKPYRRRSWPLLTSVLYQIPDLFLQNYCTAKYNCRPRSLQL